MAKISKPFITTSTADRSSWATSFAKNLYRTISQSSIRDTAAQDGENLISIVCISDTHNSKPELPIGDVLLHAGDLSQYGTFAEVQAQLDWLSDQPHSHKVVIAGNHDLILDPTFVGSHPDRELDKPGSSFRDLNWGSVTYLEDDSCTFTIQKPNSLRKLSIYGSPWTPTCGSFAYQYSPEVDLWSGEVPEDVDVLLTHGPPLAHLDEGKGCKFLLQEIWRAKPKVVVCGHIHAARGEETVNFDAAQRCFENVVLGRWLWLKLFALVVLFGWKRFAGLIGVPNHPGPATRLINAAVHKTSASLEDSDVTVVYL